jgi:hypothetical protein
MISDYSFLFNLTNNLRLDTVKELAYDTDFVTTVGPVKKDENDQSWDNNETETYTIRFGTKELAFIGDFKTCISDLSNSRLFSLQGSHANRDRMPVSLHPTRKQFKPSKIEIWVFESAQNAYRLDYDEYRNPDTPSQTSDDF